MTGAAVEERVAEVAGARARYLAAGEAGPAVVLLHAAGEDAGDWQWVMAALAGGHRLYAPDLAGRGAAVTGGPDTAAAHAAFVARFLDVLGLERAAVVGNSLGGLAALHLAAAAPERVTALGLVDSAGLGRAVHPAIAGVTTPGWGDAAVLWGSTPIGAFQRLALRPPLLLKVPARAPDAWWFAQYRIAQEPGYLAATLDGLRAQIGPEGQREVLLDLLPALRLPTLVVWGADDVIFPLEHARAAVARLPDAQLVVVPDCGHLVPVERPGECAAALADFLADAVGAARSGRGAGT